ncbi:MAG: hypothetical protein HQM09_08940 [Candidatus Riflebacteria bacterium]|nr:hypothetical protein [Candidatus Riflebacteria bacterium]
MRSNHTNDTYVLEYEVANFFLDHDIFIPDENHDGILNYREVENLLSNVDEFISRIRAENNNNENELRNNLTQYDHALERLVAHVDKYRGGGSEIIVRYRR